MLAPNSPCNAAASQCFTHEQNALPGKRWSRVLEVKRLAYTYSIATWKSYLSYTHDNTNGRSTNEAPFLAHRPLFSGSSFKFEDDNEPISGSNLPEYV
jgi:hypothetical protein